MIERVERMKPKKCLGCKIENTFNEYQNRRNMTSLMAMRNSVENFVFSMEGLADKIKDLKPYKKPQAIYQFYNGRMCERHSENFKELMDLVDKCLLDENQKIKVRKPIDII